MPFLFSFFAAFLWLGKHTRMSAVIHANVKLKFQIDAKMMWERVGSSHVRDMQSDLTSFFLPNENEVACYFFVFSLSSRDRSLCREGVYNKRRRNYGIDSGKVSLALRRKQHSKCELRRTSFDGDDMIKWKIDKNGWSNSPRTYKHTSKL